MAFSGRFYFKSRPDPLTISNVERPLTVSSTLRVTVSGVRTVRKVFLAVHEYVVLKSYGTTPTHMLIRQATGGALIGGRVVGEAGSESGAPM